MGSAAHAHVVECYMVLVLTGFDLYYSFMNLSIFFILLSFISHSIVF